MAEGFLKLIEVAETVSVSAIIRFMVSWLERHNRIEMSSR